KTRKRRLMRPESVAVRWAVVVTTVIGGLAAAIPIGQAAMRWWDDRAAGASSTSSGGSIEQGSAAADELVRQLFDAAGRRRLELNAILVGTPSQAHGEGSK